MSSRPSLSDSLFKITRRNRKHRGMDTMSDKLLLQREREKHEGHRKEKSKSPFSAEEMLERCSSGSSTRKSPDVNNPSSTPVRNGGSGGGGYCSSSPGSNVSLFSGGSSGGVGGGGDFGGSAHSKSTPTTTTSTISTKNVGVGANLNLNPNNGTNQTARQLRLSSNGPGQGGTGHSRTIALPPSNSPAPISISNVLLPDMIQQSQSQLGRPGPGSGPVANSGSMAPGNPVQNSPSPGPAGLNSSKSEISSANKIVSQNLNGTLAVTGVPTNDSELQLYRVLQRANLLNYFDVMIELGGDDVQQLCDAGEEEFLEIMALVGMASKPLHVRRLQKSLQEWMTQPHLFQIPMLSSHLPAFAPPPMSRDSHESLSPQLPIRPIPFHSGTSQQPVFLNPSELMKNLQTKFCSVRGGAGNGETHGSDSNSPLGNLLPTPVISLSSSNNTALSNCSSKSQNSIIMSQNNNNTSTMNNNHSNGYSHGMSVSLTSHSNGHHHSSSRISPDQIIPSHFLEQRIRTRSEASSPGSSVESPQLDSRTSLSPVPFLQDHEVQKLAETALHTAGGLSPSMMEPRLSAKKKMCAEFDTVMRIPETDPGRMDVVRKYAAIYGRHDCKRKVQKPLTLHELTVNEAAAQLCSRLPALLTRRDELFPLARQVVKDAGLPYGTAGSNLSLSFLPKTIVHDKSQNQKFNALINNNNNGIGITGHYTSGKRMKYHNHDSRVGDSQDLRSSFSTENESNSDDSHYPNDIASACSLNNVKIHPTDEQFSSIGKLHSSHSMSTSNGGVLDMSSNCDEPNDLSITKNLRTHKCNLSGGSNVRTTLHSNIKSEPVS